MGAAALENRGTMTTDTPAEGTTAKPRARRSTTAARTTTTTRRPRSARRPADEVSTGITITPEAPTDTGAAITITDAAEAAEAAKPRPRGCAGCAEQDARVRQLGDGVAEAMTKMETRVFVIAGIAVGVALAALAIAVYAAYAARRAGTWQGEIPAWDE